MKGKIVVIGLGVFGGEVARQLARLGYSVLGVDQAAAAVEAIKEDVDTAMVLDSTDEEALYEARIDEMPVAVVTIGAEHIEDSIMTVALLKQLQVPRIVARALNSLHGRILRQVGATEIVNPEEEMGRRVALQVARPGLREVFELTEGVCVAEVPVPPSFAGQTLASLQVRRKYNVTVLGIERVTAKKATATAAATAGEGEGEGGAESAATEAAMESGARRFLDQSRQLLLNPSPKDPLLADDKLVVVGNEADINRLSGLG
ncbi:MAG: TrkA family potassium uptake protein [Lentisphaeria bacterium]|jgi:trk system potassium uptake protein TrkA